MNNLPFLPGSEKSILRYTQRMKSIAHLFIFLSISLPINASTFLIESESEQWKGADAICAATLMKKSYKKLNGVHITEGEFKTIDCLKGTLEDFIHISWSGGIIGTSRQFIPGMPNLNEGDNAVLFLEKLKGENSEWTIRSGDMGVLRMNWDKTQNDYILQIHTNLADKSATALADTEPMTFQKFKSQQLKKYEKFKK